VPTRRASTRFREHPPGDFFSRARSYAISAPLIAAAETRLENFPRRGGVEQLRADATARYQSPSLFE